MKTMVHGVKLLSAAAVTGTDRAELEPALSGLKENFPPRALRRLPTYVRAGLMAAHLAAGSAGLVGPDASKSVGLVVATSTGCKKTGFDFMDSILDDGPQLSSPLAFSHSVINVAAGLVSLYMQFTGPSLTVIEDALSFAAALQAARSMLCLGRAPMACVIAAEENDERHVRLCGVEEPLVGAVALFLAPGETSRLSVSFGSTLSGQGAQGVQGAHQSQLCQARDFCERVQSGEKTFFSRAVSPAYGRYAEILVEDLQCT